jgi:putative redox protein
VSYNLAVLPKPPTIVDLIWTGRLEFAANLSKSALIIDSAGETGPSPVEALGAAVAGCMSVDVAHILTKGRHEFRALRARLVADRSPDDPHRFVHVALSFVIEGDVPREAVERALQLSRDKYCSVWHSMRQDIDLRVTFELVA